jgi:hypothetical protein
MSAREAVPSETRKEERSMAEKRTIRSKGEPAEPPPAAEEGKGAPAAAEGAGEAGSPGPARSPLDDEQREALRRKLQRKFH